MPSLGNWKIAPARQPKPGDYAFDLNRALESVVGLRTRVAEEAFTAEALGTERSGHGVVIRDGIVLTIGYLITEAEEIWIACNDGRLIPGHALAYDQMTGFGLVQALAPLDLAPLPLGRSREVSVGSPVVMAAAGGAAHSLSARVIARQEFAGYWEYVLDEALFTAPAHPFWGGTALLDTRGSVVGIGSLQVEQRMPGGEEGQINMVVPIDLLTPILDDLLTTGRPARRGNAWLGLFATDLEGKVYAVGVYSGAPAEHAGIRPGDQIIAVAGETVTSLADFFRKVWALGPPGTVVPLTVDREGQRREASIESSERERFLRRPRMHS